MSDYNECMRKGKVTWGASFARRAETNLVLGLPERTGFRRGGAEFLLPDGTRAVIWWPKRSDEDYGWSNTKEELGPRSDEQGYSEVLTITERNADDKLTAQRIEDEKGFLIPHPRYVFWHEKTRGVEFYKFCGVFKFDAEASDAKGCCVYRRIADEAPVNVACGAAAE